MISDYKVLMGDCMKSMRSLEPNSIQCCVTSPPYFGLRDYGEDGQIGLGKLPKSLLTSWSKCFGK